MGFFIGLPPCIAGLEACEGHITGREKYRSLGRSYWPLSCAKRLQGVVSRRGKHIAAVALANKTAGIIWNLPEKKEEYRPAAV